MISMPLFKRNMIYGFKLMIIFIAIIGMYNLVIVWMFDPELLEALNQYQEMMPEMMAAVGMTGATGTLIQFINTYLYGFIMLMFPTIFVIMIVNKFIMRYIDNGSMACLLATPNSRKKIITTQLISILLLMLILMTTLTVIVICYSESTFPDKLDIQKYILLNFATFLLQFAISGICVFAACFFNETKGYLALGGGLPMLFLLIQMMSNMGGELEKLKYFTIFTLLPKDKIIEGNDGVIVSCLILALIGTLLYVTGQINFIKKDLSL